MQLIRQHTTFARGESYWRGILRSGKVYSQLDTVQDRTRGTRPLDWHLDIVATGDCARIAELWLHTPAGDSALKIVTPRSAYVFQTGVMSLDGRSPVAQIIGRVDERDTGIGIAFIWDCTQQRLYRDDSASVLDFSAWRPGIARIGALNTDALGVQL